MASLAKKQITARIVTRPFEMENFDYRCESSLVPVYFDFEAKYPFSLRKSLKSIDKSTFVHV